MHGMSCVVELMHRFGDQSQRDHTTDVQKRAKGLSVEQPGVSPRSLCAGGLAAAAAADDTCLAAIAVPASS